MMSSASERFVRRGRLITWDEELRRYAVSFPYHQTEEQAQLRHDLVYAGRVDRGYTKPYVGWDKVRRCWHFSIEATPFVRGLTHRYEFAMDSVAQAKAEGYEVAESERRDRQKARADACLPRCEVCGEAMAVPVHVAQAHEGECQREWHRRRERTEVA